jgi:hypothetical protein
MLRLVAVVKSLLFGGTKKFLRSVLWSLVIAYVVPSSSTLATLMMEAIRSSDTWFLQHSHAVTSQKTAFFIVTAVKTSNLTPDCNYLG